MTEAIIKQVTPPNKAALEDVDLKHTQSEAALLETIKELTSRLAALEVRCFDMQQREPPKA